jgi:hypothetical protein
MRLPLLGGIGSRIEAPHSHVSSISFSSLRSIVVTCFGVIAQAHFFAGLSVERDACTAFLKSRLILASSFLVGTRFNSSRFVFASIGGSL